MHEKLSVDKAKRKGEGRSKSHPPLTDREWLVLQLVAQGLSNREISENLTLSVTTIKWYVKQIFNKLGADRRTQAIRLARELNLIASQSPQWVPKDSLPAPTTVLIGREREVATIINMLDDPSVRLVSILGLGGIGKTQLALEVARQKSSQSKLQVCFVALESVQTASGVVPAVADAVGFQFHGSADPERQLLAGVRNRQFLLILDNFEHLAEARLFVRRMLDSANKIKIIITSRERLHLHSEVVFPLKGLTYPDSSEAAEEYTSAQLFMEAIRRTHPSFQPRHGDLKFIHRICQLVEGIPLAIELATSWMEVLTLEQIADEIASSLHILKTTFQDLPERHQSMHAVFESSWRLLSNEERDIFKRLSVFQGGFDPAAAENIAGASLFTVSMLIDKSLVVRLGPDRFKLHEMLRQFAREKLQMNDAAYVDILIRHSQYYGRLAQQSEMKFKTDFALYLVTVMGILKDFDNFMAGWQQALELSLAGDIGNYAFSISLTLFFRGLIVDGEKVFARATSIVENHTNSPATPAYVRIMTYRGWFLSDLMQYEKAQQVLESALQLVTESNNLYTADAGLLLGFLGWVLYLNNQATVGRERLRQSLTTCEKLDFQLGAWISLAQLSEIEYGEGNYVLALQYQQKAMITAERHQSMAGVMNALVSLGIIYCALDDIVSASDCLKRGLVLNRDFLSPFPFFMAILGVASLCERCSRSDLAIEFLGIILFHTQRGAAVDHKARRLLVSFQKHLPENEIYTILEKAERNQLSNQYLDSGFSITVNLVDRFLQLIDSLLG